MLRGVGYILGLTFFVLGPASGLAHAIHLAESGEHHHAADCSICIQLSNGSTPPPADPPALAALDETWFFNPATSAQVLTLTFEHKPLAPRAPPFLS